MGEKMHHHHIGYADHLLEASLYLLTTALKRVFMEGLDEKVADPKAWRAQLTVYEHRYKDAGGPTITKERGR